MYLCAIMYLFFTPSAHSASKVHFSSPENRIGFCLENARKARKYAILTPASRQSPRFAVSALSAHFVLANRRQLSHGRFIMLSLRLQLATA